MKYIKNPKIVKKGKPKAEIKVVKHYIKLDNGEFKEIKGIDIVPISVFKDAINEEYFDELFEKQIENGIIAKA